MEKIWLTNKAANQQPLLK